MSNILKSLRKEVAGALESASGHPGEEAAFEAVLTMIDDRLQSPEPAEYEFHLRIGSEINGIAIKTADCNTAEVIVVDPCTPLVFKRGENDIHIAEAIAEHINWQAAEAVLEFVGGQTVFLMKIWPDLLEEGERTGICHAIWRTALMRAETECRRNKSLMVSLTSTSC